MIENRLIFKIVILILRFLKGKRARDKEQKIKSCDKNDGDHQKEPRDHQKCHNKKRDLNIKKCLDLENGTLIKKMHYDLLKIPRS